MFSCAVDGCKNRVEFIFPGNVERKRKWLEAIKRPAYVPKKRHGLCSLHFKTDHFIHESRDGGFMNSRRILRKDAVPCIFGWNISSEAQCNQEIYDTKPMSSEQLPIVRIDVPIKEEIQDEDSMLENVGSTEMMDFRVDGCVDGVKDEMIIKQEPLWPNGYAENKECTASRSTQTSRPLAFMTIEHFRDRPDAVLYYTGLESYKKFMTVLHSLGQEVYRLRYPGSRVMGVSAADQLFITLWKLRRNCTDFELSINFDVSKETISNIIYTWVKFMAHQWSKINIWPSKKVVQHYMPPSFRMNCPSTRIHTDKPSDSRIQQSTYSLYKNRNTFEVLIGTNSRGLISHCSPTYSRSASGRQITRQSTVLDKCDLGNSIIADKGFNLQDIFSPKDVKTNTRTFLKWQGNSSAKTAIHDRKLAKDRVHIERIISLTKTYKILDTALSHHHMPLASEIFSVIIMLCSFRKENKLKSQ